MSVHQFLDKIELFHNETLLAAAQLRTLKKGESGIKKYEEVEASIKKLCGNRIECFASEIETAARCPLKTRELIIIKRKSDAAIVKRMQLSESLKKNHSICAIYDKIERLVQRRMDLLHKKPPALYNQLAALHTKCGMLLNNPCLTIQQTKKTLKLLECIERDKEICILQLINGAKNLIGDLLALPLGSKDKPAYVGQLLELLKKLRDSGTAGSDIFSLIATATVNAAKAKPEIEALGLEETVTPHSIEGSFNALLQKPNKEFLETLRNCLPDSHEYGYDGEIPDLLSCNDNQLLAISDPYPSTPPMRKETRETSVTASRRIVRSQPVELERPAHFDFSLAARSKLQEFQNELFILISEESPLEGQIIDLQKIIKNFPVLLKASIEAPLKGFFEKNDKQGFNKHIEAILNSIDYALNKEPGSKGSKEEI